MKFSMKESKAKMAIMRKRSKKGEERKLMTRARHVRDFQPELLTHLCLSVQHFGHFNFH